MIARSSLPLRELADDVYVAPQLSADDMAEVARAGFRSVINNRPDFEGGPDQPTDALVAAAAEAAGLVYRYLPVAGGHQTPDEVVAFAALMVELPRPVLAFCRSGARSARLYTLAQAL
jgi:uncharacterized protein (TIGR01244 family)